MPNLLTYWCLRQILEHPLKALLRDAFGAETVIATVEFPSRLGTFMARLPNKHRKVQKLESVELQQFRGSPFLECRHGCWFTLGL